MIALARERRIAGRGVDAATRLAAAAARVWEKPLPMNVSMAIAATLRDADVPAAIIRGVPILARTAGLIAHLAEEAETPIGFYMASQAEEAIAYAGPEAGAPKA
jgi:citrate synthase